MIRLYHKACNGHIAWYVDELKAGTIIKSNKYFRLDGSNPKPGEAFNEICPKCGEKIKAISSHFVYF